MSQRAMYRHRAMLSRNGFRLPLGERKRSEVITSVAKLGGEGLSKPHYTEFI